MHVYRAVCSCPNCFTFHEVWNYKSKISPEEMITCTSCNTIFDPSDYIINFLTLKQDISVSAVDIASNAEILLPVS